MERSTGVAIVVALGTAIGLALDNVIAGLGISIAIAIAIGWTGRKGPPG